MRIFSTMIQLSSAFSMMQESVDSLRRSGVIQREISIGPETILLGTGSALDSLGFVAFMTDLEDRLMRALSADVHLILSEIHGFNVSDVSLNGQTMAEYLVVLSQRKPIV
jgi:hypothetical protein